METKRFLKKIEVVANVAVVAVSLLVGLVIIRSYLLPAGWSKATSASTITDPSTNLKKPSRLQPGSSVKVDGIEWQKSEQTLVLALSTTCHFCSESAPLYQKIARERGNGTRIVAVFPQDTANSTEYLQKLALNVDQVVKAPLGSIGVSGTPTLILINREGAVLESWIGKLPAIEESKLISRINPS
jgi:thiol-disulfide isomerase/thioredoxin